MMIKPKGGIAMDQMIKPKQPKGNYQLQSIGAPVEQQVSSQPDESKTQRKKQGKRKKRNTEEELEEEKKIANSSQDGNPKDLSDHEFDLW